MIVVFDIPRLTQLTTQLADRAKALNTLVEARRNQPGFSPLDHIQLARYSVGTERHMKSFIEFAIAYIAFAKSKGTKPNRRAFNSWQDRSSQKGTIEQLAATFNEVVRDFNSGVSQCGSIVPCDDTGCPAR